MTPAYRGCITLPYTFWCASCATHEVMNARSLAEAQDLAHWYGWRSYLPGEKPPGSTEVWICRGCAAPSKSEAP